MSAYGYIEQQQWPERERRRKIWGLKHPEDESKKKVNASIQLYFKVLHFHGPKKIRFLLIKIESELHSSYYVPVGLHRRWCRCRLFIAIKEVREVRKRGQCTERFGHLQGQGRLRLDVAHKADEHRAKHKHVQTLPLFIHHSDEVDERSGEEVRLMQSTRRSVIRMMKTPFFRCG